MNIPLACPDITQQEIDAVVEVLKTNTLSLGPKVPEFEEKFARYCQAKHAIACCNGTSGLHMLVRAMGIGRDDEVITTPFTFIATCNCIAFENAKPVFVDIDPETWNIDPACIEEAITPKTRGIIPVDVFGQAPDFDPINEIARKHNLRVIEDSCEALGGSYKGRPAGTLGEAGVFGFYPNKQMTTGEGGMIVTDDDELDTACRALRNQGRSGMGWLAHEQLGYNYRLPDINCAIGSVQIDRVPTFVEKRAKVAAMYMERLKDESRLTFQKIHPDVKMSWFVFVIRLSDDYTQDQRNTILTRLQEKGIGCSNYFVPVHLQPYYQNEFGYKEGDFPITEALGARSMALPFHNNLTEEEVDIVCRELKALL